MPSCNVHILNEIIRQQYSGWSFCLQRCHWVYSDGGRHDGYRTIWRRPDGSLQAARGQSRWPSFAIVYEMMKEAEAQGWGHFTASNIEGQFEEEETKEAAE